MPDIGFRIHDAPEAEAWSDPDMSLVDHVRRAPPPPPLAVLGGNWAKWICNAAEAAACPHDYVLAPLLAMAATLIGNARWAMGNSGWSEPPHLWFGCVGDSGSGKSPGSDTLLGQVLPELERQLIRDFPDRLADWRTNTEIFAAAQERWKLEVRAATKNGNAPPPLTAADPGPEPQSPRIRQSDTTIEKLAALLAAASPKGLLVVRDELAGWLLSMNAYNDGGRAFWLEAYGGRPFRVERQKSSHPIDVPHLVVGVIGGTQPDRLAELMREADDGLLARIQWVWPDPIPFRLGRAFPQIDWAIRSLDRLRMLEMQVDHEGRLRPIKVPLDEDALNELEDFGREMQERQGEAAGLMKSAYGKARGTALRLSLVLEHLWWCEREDMSPPPTVISRGAFISAATLVADYLMPMAERVYGDAAIPVFERRTTTLARWIIRNRPSELHVRALQRQVRLPGFRTAEDIHQVCRTLVDAGWLKEPERGGGHGRPKNAYPVNPKLRANDL